MGAQVSVGDHFREERGRVVITATDAIQHALGGAGTADQRGPSLFSSHVIRGLATGEADLDRDGEVSSKDLYDYVREQMQAGGNSQRPQRWVFGGELHLAATLLTPPVLHLIKDADPEIRLVGVRALGCLLESPSDGLALAASQGLEQLCEDSDSRVSSVAAEVLGGIGADGTQ
jgi:hypothetical protein